MSNSDNIDKILGNILNNQSRDPEPQQACENDETALAVQDGLMELKQLQDLYDDFNEKASQLALGSHIVKGFIKLREEIIRIEALLRGNFEEGDSEDVKIQQMNRTLRMERARLLSALYSKYKDKGDK